MKAQFTATSALFFAIAVGYAGAAEPRAAGIYSADPLPIVGADGSLLTPTHSGLTRSTMVSGMRAALPEVAIVASASGDVTDAAFTDPQQKLIDSGQFASVTVIHAGLVTPSVAELNEFAAVLVWSNFDFADATALGDNLAAYLELGGGVVSAVFGNTSSTSGRFLDGAWIADGHFIIEQQQGNTNGLASLGTVSVPGHPVMNGVASFAGGTMGFRPETTNVTTGGVLVASWTDGKPLVAAREVPDLGKRVDLGFYPPSSDVLSGFFWDAATDGDLLMANALTYVSRPEPDIALRVVALQSPSGVDTTSDPDALPGVIGAFGACGQSFVLEFWASDVGSTNSGLLGLYLDIAFDDQTLQAVAMDHGGLFTQFTEGSIDNPNGAVVNFGGFSFTPQAVEPVWGKLGHIEFTAVGDELTTVTTSLGLAGIAVSGRSAPPVSEIEFGSADVLTYMLGDIDVDCDIDARDFAAFQRCFDELTPPAECFRADFGGSSFIELDDYAAFNTVITGP